MTAETTPMHGPDWPTAQLEVPPEPFPGEFRLLERLGGGGFGVVYKALDLSPLGRLVALKFLSPHPPFARSLPALRNEARLLASVRHPNIVQALAWKTTANGLPCLVMEFVPGGSLGALLRSHGPLPWPRASRYVADIAAGVAGLHEKGIVHRDIKPDNMLLDDERDEALLTDLGISARVSDGPPSAGTLPFMPPEAFDGHISPELDVYGLAASLFCLLTGEPPFAGRSPVGLIAACRDGLPDNDPRLSSTPASLEALIRAGLAADLSERLSLADLSSRLRGELNRLLADALASGGRELASGGREPADVSPSLRLVVSHQLGAMFVPAVASLPPTGATRDMQKVPLEPQRVSFHTGDRVRVEVEASEPGHVTVFNIGPTGNLHLLSAAQQRIRPSEPLHVLDVVLTPPAGLERLFALWTRSPLPLRPEDLRSLVEPGGLPTAGAYRATRDLARVKEAFVKLPASDRAAVVLELQHQSASEAPLT
jgi:serine/threonine protein kinase